jgi:putative phage-type endonuclease
VVVIQVKEASAEDIAAVEMLTREQGDSKLWREERTKRITASNFGLICKAGSGVDQSRLANRLVSPTEFTSRATAHGKQYEPVAVEQFEKTVGLKTNTCGLFISQICPWLAASPDRIIDVNTLVEVKCPFSAKQQSISCATVPYLHKEGNDLVLHKNSDYYYQVQGQLFCTERSTCYFCVYTLNDFVCMKIDRDDEFIAEMLNRLNEFHVNFHCRAVLNKFMYRCYDKHF